jgi:hypothetical protein
MTMNWFGDGVDYPGLTELLEATCASIFPNNEINDAAERAASGDHIALMEYEDMLAQVLDASFSREPKLFGEIMWVDSDLGTPMWVRPGTTWRPDTETDEDTKGMKPKPKFKHTVIANRRAFVAGSITDSALAMFQKSQQRLS